MSVADPERLFTPEDLLAHPNGKHLELVDGQFVEKQRGAEANWVVAELIGELRDFARKSGVGRVFSSEMGFQCFAADRSRVRKPDVSFVKSDHLPSNWRTCGFFSFPPDLAVEVIWPNDGYSEVQRKVNEYLEAGVSLTWVIDPEVRCVEVYRANGTGILLREDGELNGEDVLPGFRYPLRALFSAE